MAEKPRRVQLSRKKGWTLPPNTAKVDRSTRFGNPCLVGRFACDTVEEAIATFSRWVHRDAGFEQLDSYSLKLLDRALGKPPTLAEIKAQLRGKNLACWCALDAPCHADVLLEIANADR
jgi:hypothetical protein